jgi:hypothetical protein
MGEGEGKAPGIIILGKRWGKWPISHSRRFPSREIPLGTHVKMVMNKLLFSLTRAVQTK